ncbi:uncharacterized protein B0I36DRAFT_386347 [Microdochium trichocladiopsis]|uniref:Uncharacterized protein n=1 Tax=Microdochium trichocladiopsis TaxID=1682393 RepID=A0A9P9BML6_9PEZI|nr:uncharacterized protein B0I36DRAFT_386347 [Microdochium trichocladiopsis]KAH7025991.1 hypothetical protein B0I36DRAFT_386347 [Microdochium trichocladiopsis]
MPYRTRHTTTTTTRRRGGLFSGSHSKPARTHRTHHTTAAPVHHHKRKTTLKDKVSGAMLKLKGTLTHRPAQKAAGTKRMHGTDGRGSRRSTRLTTRRHY